MAPEPMSAMDMRFLTLSVGGKSMGCGVRVLSVLPDQVWELP
jgi:hypothetical protein